MKIKNIITLTALILIAFSGCSEKAADNTESDAKALTEDTASIESMENDDEEIEETPDEYVEDDDENGSDKTEAFNLKISSDKHIAYLNNYVGMNAASVGYTSLGGERRENVGSANISIIYVASDGTYVGVDNEEDLKNWKIVSQSFEPNTEIKVTFTKDSDGNEYSYLTEWQSIDKIDLGVVPVKSSENGPTLIPTKISPDKYTYYLRNYVGKNLASVGYESLGGDYRDKYGSVNIKLNLNADDGSYIDITESENLRNYIITAQNIEPDTEIICTYSKDSSGNEYSFADYQSIKEISLTVHSLN